MAFKFIKTNGGYSRGSFIEERNGNCFPTAVSLMRGVARQGVPLKTQQNLYNDTVDKMWLTNANRIDEFNDGDGNYKSIQDMVKDYANGLKDFETDEYIYRMSEVMDKLKDANPNKGRTHFDRKTAKNLGFNYSKIWAGVDKETGNKLVRRMDEDSIKNLSHVFKHGVVLSIQHPDKDKKHATFVYKGDNVDMWPSLNKWANDYGEVYVDGFMHIPEYTGMQFRPNQVTGKYDETKPIYNNGDIVYPKKRK